MCGRRGCCTISPQEACAERGRGAKLQYATTRSAEAVSRQGVRRLVQRVAANGHSATLARQLDARVRPGELVEPLADHAVRCLACGHRCLIRPGRRGICKVRFNQDGILFVPFGYVAALQCDPTEKKPFFHCLPGSDTLTFGMLGCDFHCGYCQNWLTSQALRDGAAGVTPNDVTPEGLVQLARQEGAAMVGSSYNEPLITAEWAVEVFRAARAAGLKTAFISNGNATREVLDFIGPWTDCYKIDLKAMDPHRYRELGGVLDHVLDAVRMVHERGLWLEVVTLVIPGFNDDDEQLRQAAEFLVSVSPEIPWHVTAFHKDYRMTEPDNTSVDTLLRACAIGTEAGLRFVYAGNIPGRVGRWEHTWCPDCGGLLIERVGYVIRRQRIGADGTCPSCRRRIPGIWR
jgi:pyruvate formate lyase activating enzyme